MFGVAPIRTRSEQMELAHAGIPPRSHVETGAESALYRTTALLESTSRQQKYIACNLHLAADARADEMAALSLLRNCLTQLQACILAHDNPPPTISKRKALIKVEKARREVLAAVRECSSHVTESQRLFEEVERFIELRPEEAVSPRPLNIKWSRKAPPRPVPRRRDQAMGRVLRPGDSLVASIVGLSAIAEGREQDTPTSDVGGPTSSFAPGPLAAKPREPMAPPRAQEPPPPLQPQHPQYQHRPALSINDGGPAGTAASATEGPVLCTPGREDGAAQSRTLSAMALSQAKDAAALMQRLQLKPRATSPSSEGGDDLRPSLSHDVALSTATTMCNMDSCVSGPNRGPTSMQATTGRDTSYSDNDDEVNSAEGRCFDAGSPNHRVALLGQRGGAGGPTRSTASTPPAPPQHLQAPAGAPMAPATTARPASSNHSVAPSHDGFTADSRAYAAMEQQRQHSSANPADTALPPHDVGPFGPVHPGGAPWGPVSSHHSLLLSDDAKASAVALELDAIAAIAAPVHELAYAPTLRSRYAPTSRPAVPQAAAPAPAAPTAAATTASMGPGAGMMPSAAHVPNASPQRPVASEVSAAAIMPPQQYPLPQHSGADAGNTGAQGMSGQGRLLPPSLPRAYSTAGAPQPHALPPAPPQQQHISQHPAHAAAAAAAAAHPYAGNGFSHPYMGGSLGGAPPGSGGYSLPPSVPSSLRDFPMGHPAARPPGAGGVHGAVQIRYGSQPPSGHHSLDSGQFPASATGWDNVSLADTEPMPGAAGAPRRGRRGGRRRGGGLFGIVRNVVGFVGVSMLSGAAMVLGAAAVNTGLDEQEASQQSRRGGGAAANNGRSGRRIGRGGDDLIPQRTLQQLRSPDLLALGRG